MKRLRVVHLITMLELGGAQELVLQTAAGLDRDRFDSRLISGPGGLLDAEACRLEGVDVAFCPHLQRQLRPWSDLRAFFELRGLLAAWKPDLVHTNSSKAGILGRLAAAAAGVPVIVHTVHGWGFHRGQPRLVQAVYALAEKLAGGATTRWIAVSEANARLGAAWRIAPFSAFEIIRPGIRAAVFQAALGNGKLRRELGLSAGDPLVGMVACLKPQKRPLDFVALAARLAAGHPRAHFVLAGDGELRGAMERAIAGSGLAGRFHLLGWRRDPEIVIGDLDILVLTSLHEGLPMVIPEAMAAGKPVVATAVDGVPEAVVEGETGFLKEPGDVAGLAQAVGRLLGDPGLARRMGETARSRAAGWDIAAMVSRLEETYLDLAAAAGLTLRPGAD